MQEKISTVHKGAAREEVTDAPEGNPNVTAAKER